MIEFLKHIIKGWVTIRDKVTGEVLVDKANAVHYGNISTEIAQALTGYNDSFITYMAFGNGGVIIDSSGTIIYRPPKVSETKNPSEQLYNSTLVVEMTNAANDIPPESADVTVPGGNTQNFEDIVSVVNLPSGFPKLQEDFDDATGLTVARANGDIDTSNTSATYVFNEIALYTGPKGLPLDFSTTLSAESSITSFLNDPNTRMITHIIFHPVQKSQNRTLEITYTLRIQMGD